jgi:hypothetical protein
MYLLIATAMVATFPGGTINDLARSLNTASGKPAVIVLSGSAKALPGFEFNAADPDDLAQVLRTKVNLVLAPGVDMVVHDGYVPFDKVGKGAPTGNSMMAKPFTEAAVSGGKVTFATEKNESLQLESLKGFAKPVTVHWFYPGLTVAVNAKDVPEMDFLGLVAKGIGARFHNSGNNFKIEFDPVEVRTRAIRTIQFQPQGAKPQQPQAPTFTTRMQDFRIAALNSLTPAQLSELFKAPGNTIKTPIRSGSNIERLAVALVREMEAQTQTQTDDAAVANEVNSRVLIGGQTRAQNRRPGSILARVDPRRQAMLVTDTNFQAWVEVPVLGGNGNSVETILRPESRVRSFQSGGSMTFGGGGL